MSLTFTQIIDTIDDVCGTNSTSFTTAKKTVAVNVALDEALAIIFQQGGMWQFDDKNHTEDPIIITDLTANQRDYHFTTDEQSNVILDVLAVWTKNSASGVFKKLARVDMSSGTPLTMNDGQARNGVPTKYGLIGNGIFLDLIPSYSSTGGLKIIVNRQASYFVSTDTTKTAGIDGLCHDFLYLKPAYEYARNKNLTNKETLFRDLQIAIQKLKDRYKTKERKIISRLIPFYEDNR